MRSWLSVALAAGCFLSGGAWASAPPRFDVAKALLIERVRTEGGDNAIEGSIAEWTRQLQSQSGSPYSDVIAEPDLQNEIYWEALLDHLPDAPGQPSTATEALTALRWDLGLTKAKPYADIPASALETFDTHQLAPRHRDPLVFANIIKAGVDPDLFEAALRATTEVHSTVAASYAVAAQIVRDRARRHPASAWKAMGVRHDVVDRLIAVQTPGDLLDADRDYLGRLAEREAERRHVGAFTALGLRELPTTLRIARIAAAYRNGQSFYSVTQAPCFADGTYRPGVAGELIDGDERPLCFTDATDSAVYRWYTDELWRQANHVREHLYDDSWAPAIFKSVLGLMLVADLANAASFLESLLADDLVSDDIIAEDIGEHAFERHRLLPCRMP